MCQRQGPAMQNFSADAFASGASEYEPRARKAKKETVYVEDHIHKNVSYGNCFC